MRRRTVALLLASAFWTAEGTPGPGALAAPHPALKRTVAVYQFQNADAQSAGSATADGLTAMLTDALVRDGRFVVVERDDLTSIATEQQLGAQNSTTAESAASAGKMIGASLIIRGSVTKFEPNAGASSISVGGFGFGRGGADGVGLRGGHAVIAIALRVIDASTGQVLDVVKARGEASSRGLDVQSNSLAGRTISASTLRTTPLGKAAEDAIDKAVPQIVLAADRRPWTAAVIEADGATVYVNAGAEENLEPGMVFAVRRKAKTLTDPATGAVIDTLMSDVGTIRIDAVRPKTATAVVVDGATPARGDLLEPK